MYLWDTTTTEEKQRFLFEFARTLGATSVNLDGSVWVIAFSEGNPVRLPSSTLFSTNDIVAILNYIGTTIMQSRGN